MSGGWLKRPARWAAPLLACVFLSDPAQAHPHVFVTVRSIIDVGADRKIVSVRQNWTFDEMYTAFAVTGFGKDSESPSAQELHEIAQQNMEDMAASGYFTVLRIGGRKASFAKPVDYSASLVKTNDDFSLRLVFTLPLSKPEAIAKSMSLQVYDPSYFAAFSFAKQGGATFSGDHGACAANLTTPKPLNAGEQASLTESFFTNMLPGSDFGVKLADTFVLSCR